MVEHDSRSMTALALRIAFCKDPKAGYLKEAGNDNTEPNKPAANLTFGRKVYGRVLTHSLLRENKNKNKTSMRVCTQNILCSAFHAYQSVLAGRRIKSMDAQIAINLEKLRSKLAPTIELFLHTDTVFLWALIVGSVSGRRGMTIVTLPLRLDFLLVPTITVHLRRG